MNKNEIYLKSFDPISEEVKYITNSVIRLKILAMINKRPRKTKEIKNLDGASSSSISSNMNDLELREYIFLKSNRYYLSNSMKMLIAQIVEFEDLLVVVDKFYSIFDDHIVNVIPKESVYELFLLKGADMIESDDIHAYKTYSYIENSLNSAKKVNCIMPFYHHNFNDILNNLVKMNKSVEAMVSEEIYPVFKENSDIKELSSFRRKNNFLLISTDKVMIMGLFKKDGHFDQNRLLISKTDDSIRWADNLFRSFKEKYK